MVKNLLISTFVFLAFGMPILVLAAASSDAGRPSGSSASGGEVTLANPLGDANSTFRALIERVLDAAFVVGLPVAVLFIVLAGFRFVAARGNETALSKAKLNLLYTVIGIGIFFGAWVLANIIAETLRSLGAQI